MKSRHTKPSSSSTFSPSSTSSQFIKIILRPNQSFDTTFEYRSSHQILQITEFISANSPLLLHGGRIGMYLFSIDNVTLMGLAQQDILFILQQKKQNLREIVLTNCLPKDKNVDFQTRNSLPKLNPTPADAGPTGKRLHSTHSPLLSSSSSVTPSLSSSTSSESFGSSPSLTKASPHYHSAMTASRPSPYSSNSSSLRSRTSSSSAPDSSPPSDPFSTPARRRRLIADIARFLLRQYCVKACEQVAYDRYRNQCALKIQCFLRQAFARKILRRLRFARDTAQSLVIQRFYRCLLAREQLEDRIRNRWRAKYLAMVLRVQKKYRQHHHTQRYQLMLSSVVKMQRVFRVFQRRREEKRRRLAKKQQKEKEEMAARRIQNKFRVYRARAVYRELYLKFCHQKMMKFRILQSWRWSQQRKKEAATLLIQCQFRILQSKRRLLKIQKLRLQESNERALMATEDLYSRYVHEHTIELTLCLHINPTLASCLRQFQILPFLCWCIEHHLLSFDSLSDSYAVGTVIRNLLAHWEESQHHSSSPVTASDSSVSAAVPISALNDASASLKRIEISNTSIQNDTSSSSDLITFPDSLQCPQDWGRRYPLILSPTQHRPQTSFRSWTNRWGQIILSFDNFLSWSQLLGKPVTSVTGNLYNLRIMFGDKDLVFESSSSSFSAQGSNTTLLRSEEEKKIPELEFHNLEVVITVVTASASAVAESSRTMNSRQVVCRIESETFSTEPPISHGDLAADAALTDRDDLHASRLCSQSRDLEDSHGVSQGEDESDDYETLIGEDLSPADEIPDSESAAVRKTSLPLSRPTTATTRLYITAPPMPKALTDEEILEGHRAVVRGNMIPVFKELLHKVFTSYLRKRQVKIDEFQSRIMATRIQVSSPFHSPAFCS
jgi:hypothetical protein